MAYKTMNLPKNLVDLIYEFADLNPAYSYDDENDVLETFKYDSMTNIDRHYAVSVGEDIAHACDSVPVVDQCNLRSIRWMREYLGAEHGLSWQQLFRSSMHNKVQAAWNWHAHLWPMTTVMEDENGDEVEFVMNPTFDAVELFDEDIRPHSEGLHDVRSLVHRGYFVRPVGTELNPSPRRNTVSEAVALRRVLITALKAELMLRVVTGQLAFATAESFVDDSSENKYLLLAYRLVELCLLFAFAAAEFANSLWNSLSMHWYYSLPRELQAILDVVCLTVLVWFLVRFFVKRELPLKIAIKRKDNQFLGQLADARGIVYRVRVDGREYELLACPGAVTHEDEMSMPGSEYFPCRAQPIGAILVSTDDTDLQVFGTFWRMDDYLITARHCSNTLAQSTATVYLATIRPTKKGNYEIDRTTMYRTDESFFDSSNNVIAYYDVDAFATQLSEKLWAQIRIQKASTKIRSAYNQQVHSVGFTPTGLLVSASGKTLADSGFEVLKHTASTQKGFSGSILLCGSSVVGMHVSAAGDHNLAVRTGLIQYLIDEGTANESKSKNTKKYTYADASYKEHYRQDKWRGGIVEIKRMRDGNCSIILENGEATYGWGLRDLVECFGIYGNEKKDEDYIQDLLADSIFKKKNFGSYVDFDDEPSHRNRFHECANCLPRETSTLPTIARNSSKSVKNKSGKRRTSKILLEKKDSIYKVTTGLKPIHGPSAPKLQPEAVKVIEAHKEEIVRLGYEEGTFEYPEMDYNVERKSLENHLELFSTRVKSIKQLPDKDVISRAAAITAEMMRAATFQPDSDYNKPSGILKIINSSMVDPNKAAGFPYVVEGMPLNGNVLSTYGEKGFAQHVINEWDEKHVNKVFIKGEPTKLKKLKAGMPRIIINLPLHKTVKHASIFKNLAFNCVKNWKELPIKYAFSPALPGHLEHLKECLPGTCYESDKTNWDFMFYQYIADGVCQVVKSLAVRPAEWTEDDFNAYLKDIDNAFDEIFKQTHYRTSDGTLYEMLVDGIMKSGWFLTITGNSIAQLYLHVLVLILMGHDDKFIMEQKIFAGGDDVNQDLDNVDVEKYVSIAKDIGVAMEIIKKDSLEQSEYFSSDIRELDGKMTFHPKRWTKHIEHLKTVDKENLANALCSHMQNYRHDKEKFTVLENLYHDLRKDHPGCFPLGLLKSRCTLVAQQYGYEFNC